eukprot:gene22425-biopygen5748
MLLALSVSQGWDASRSPRALRPGRARAAGRCRAAGAVGREARLRDGGARVVGRREAGGVHRLQGETAEDASDASGTRPGRVRFFKIHRVGRVRDVSAAVSPRARGGVGGRRHDPPRRQHTHSVVNSREKTILDSGQLHPSSG